MPLNLISMPSSVANPKINVVVSPVSKKTENQIRSYNEENLNFVEKPKVIISDNELMRSFN